MTPNMSHGFRNGLAPEWSFAKAMTEFSPKASSETSSIDFAEMHGEFTLGPTMQEVKQTIVEQTTPANFNDRYMSSEEQLSPTEHDSEFDELDDDDDCVVEIGIAAPLQFTVCDMAVAICVVAAGQPKVVDVSTPMQKHSLFSRPGIGFGRASWMPRRSNAVSKPRFSARNSDRPTLPTLYSVPTMNDVHATTIATASTVASTAPSTASDTSPVLSSSFTTPPTSAYTESDSHGSPRSLLSNTFSSTTSPRKDFSADQSTTKHSFLEHDPYENSSPPSHRKHSRFRNLSQKIKLPRFGKANIGVEEEVTTPQKDSFDSIKSVTPLIPQHPPRRKMIARGAAEREPIIQIPPCPYDLDNDGSLILDSPRRRRGSFGF